MNIVETNSNPSEAQKDSVATGAEYTTSVKRLDVGKLRGAIGYTPLRWQLEALKILNNSECEYLILPEARRTGKSFFISDVANIELHIPDSEHWVVAPSYELGTRIYDNNELWANLHFPYLKCSSRNTTPTIENKELRSVLRIKSADSRENLKGQNPTRGTVDEASHIDNEVFWKYLQPSFDQRYLRNGVYKQPQKIIAFNPEGKGHWTWDLWQMALKGEKGYFQMHVPLAIEDSEGNIIGTNNPIAYTVEKLKQIKLNTPIFEWESQWLGKFRESGGQIFQELGRAKGGRSEKFNPAHRYEIGWDPARTSDFSVITVVDQTTHRLVWMDRFQKLDWAFQIGKVKYASEQYGRCRVRIDSTGLGDPLFDWLRQKGVTVDDFKFTQKSKEDLIKKLSLLIQHGQILIPAEYQVIFDELEMFGTLTRDGKLKYEAPSGKHDDTVCSLALACWDMHGDPIGEAGIRRDDLKIEEVRRKVKRFQYA